MSAGDKSMCAAERARPAPSAAKPLELNEVRACLQAARGPHYWRSLEELAATPQFTDLLHREFPRHATEWDNALSRRRFLEVMAASLALAGLSGCTRQPTETIVPYVRQPEEFVPGKPLFYATAMTLSGVALPLLAESHMGRPTKIEGNPEHPASLGATDIYAQASVLGLYDPDRSQTLRNLGEVRPWTSFLGSMRGPMAIQKTTGGGGLRILTETVSSPTLAWQIGSLLRDFPNAKWHQYEPVNRDNARAGSQMAFGQFVDAQYRFENADVIVSLDADFLSSGYPGFVRYARDFAKRRKLEAGNTKMSRLYVVESTPTNTGAVADHRLAMRATDIAGLAHALAGAFGIGSHQAAAQFEQWSTAIASELQAHRGTSLILAGENQPPTVHALAHAMNEALGNVGRTVIYTDPVAANPVIQTESLRELVAEMEAGKVELLVILGGNPVFNAPVDIAFAKHLHKVGLRVHLGLYHDETAALCHWHVPEAHYLESWSDARAYDGTVSIVQPLIAPLYDGKTAHEVLAALTDRPDRSAYEIVREYWKTQHPASDFEMFWRRSLHDGWIEGTSFAPRQVTAKTTAFPQAAPIPAALELTFRPDPSVYDGRFAGNGWLQELPKPLSKLTWENAAFFSPRTAERERLKTGDVIELHFEGRQLKAPVYILPGQPDESVCVHLGYGRHRAGRVGSNIGFNAYALRNAGSFWFGGNLRIAPQHERHELSVTHGHWNMEGRDLVRAGTLAEYVANPRFAHEHHEEPAPGLTLYPPHKYEGNAWGMAIDLNSCIGCNACVVACQSENNIPVVGREQVMVQREMHWIRIDRYFEGSLDDPRIYFQPVPCMQCENAPCEPVCPVGATVHSSEGLNDQVYNRCVGTRYCANNCPYKVRRFNFLLYQDFETPSLKLMRNPDVSVRSRGVMEKCTYCVQRINAARIAAEKEDRTIRDGEVQTACQQACPAGAIIFGNINDKDSRVARVKQEARNYGLLAELNTRPRTTYLASVRNPNPALAAEKKA
ncbi:MAG TPA: TAT-variant-translocated molybdopterin oxidoreductase [Terriglobales bacterium]|nr:TAT-variant-translocated molybdopterin oxidoreductase [Terriglobales bacterium]